MPEELKIRIRGYKSVEDHLIQLGAHFTEERTVVDTYFYQPKGVVLKITEDDTGDFLVNLKSQNGKFQIIQYQKLDNADTKKKELTKKYGMKCILKKKRRFFALDTMAININLIEGVGEFLIVEGEEVSRTFITDRLKIPHPEFVTVSFDELKHR